MKFLVYQVILTLLLSGCIRNDKKTSKKELTKAPEILIDSAFNFSFKESTDFYDSKIGTFTRRYQNSDSTLNIELTKKELNLIEKKYIENGLDTLPRNYTPTCRVEIMPSFNEIFEVSYKGYKRTFVFNYDYKCENKNTQEIVLNMKVFREFVVEILEKRQNIKELKNSDIMFL